jgi:hypothetical protein
MVVPPGGDRLLTSRCALLFFRRNDSWRSARGKPNPSSQFAYALNFPVNTNRPKDAVMPQIFQLGVASLPSVLAKNAGRF